MHNYTCPIGEGMGISSLKTLGKMDCMISTKNKEDTASKSIGFLFKLYSSKIVNFRDNEYLNNVYDSTFNLYKDQFVDFKCIQS